MSMCNKFELNKRIEKGEIYIDGLRGKEDEESKRLFNKAEIKLKELKLQIKAINNKKELELNKIYNEDCLEGMKRIDDNSVDMILCDLPYGTTDIKGWDKIIPNELLWEQYKRIIKDDGSIVLFGTEPFSSYLRLSNIKMYRYDWVWDKTRGANFLNANCQPLKCHENILVFTKLPASPNKKGTSKYNPQKEGDEEYISKLGGKTKTFNGGDVKTLETKLKGKHPKTILEFKKDGKLHPTQKPIALLEFLIKSYTNKGDVVLDNCMGSGSTAVASINTGRNFIGFEKDEKFWGISQERIKGLGV